MKRSRSRFAVQNKTNLNNAMTFGTPLGSINQQISYADIFGYLRFNIPYDLIEQHKYSYILQLSYYPEFPEQSIFRFKLYSSSQQEPQIQPSFELANALIFHGGVWTPYKNLIFSSINSGDEVQINIVSVFGGQRSNKLPVFGRYKLVDLTTNWESQFIAAGISCSNYNDIEVNTEKLTNFYIYPASDIDNLMYTVPGISGEFVARGVKYNKNTYRYELLDLTSSTIFQVFDSSYSKIQNNIFSITNNSTKTQNQIVIGKIRYNEINYQAAYNFITKPVQLLSYHISGNNSIDEGLINEYKTFGSFSNGQFKDLTSSTVFTETFENCSLISGNLLKCNDVVQNSQVGVLNAQLFDNNNLIGFDQKLIKVNAKKYSTFVFNQITSGNLNNSQQLFEFSYSKPSANFQILLSGAEISLGKDVSHDVKIYEFGSQYLDIQNVEVQLSGEIKNLKNILVKDFSNIFQDTKVTITVSYESSDSGNTMIRTYSILIYAKPQNINKDQIQTLLIEFPNNETATLTQNRSTQFKVYGLKNDGVNKIDLTNSQNMIYTLGSISPLNIVSSVIPQNDNKVVFYLQSGQFFKDNVATLKATYNQKGKTITQEKFINLEASILAKIDEGMYNISGDQHYQLHDGSYPLYYQFQDENDWKYFQISGSYLLNDHYTYSRQIPKAQKKYVNVSLISSLYVDTSLSSLINNIEILNEIDYPHKRGIRVVKQTQDSKNIEGKVKVLIDYRNTSNNQFSYKIIDIQVLNKK